MSSAKIITVKPNQSIWDIALKHHGAIEGVFEIIDENPGFSLNTDLQDNQEINVNNTVINAGVKKYYDDNNIDPASRPI